MAAHEELQDARRLLDYENCSDPEVQPPAEREVEKPPASSSSRASRAALAVLACVAAGAVAGLAVASGTRGVGQGPLLTWDREAVEIKSEQKAEADNVTADVQCPDCSWSHAEGACAASNNDGTECWEICCEMARGMKDTPKKVEPEHKGRKALDLPSLFGSHMVLPAGAEVKLYGWAKPDTGSVVVMPSWGEELSAEPDYDSWYWEVMLPASDISTKPAKIVVSTEADSITLTDVLFGELYMCVGASNIDFRLDWATDAQKALKETIQFSDTLRIIKIKKQEGKEPADNFVAQFPWQRVKDDNHTAEFSALCYFYGVEQINRRPNTPVGLIQASWGATAGWQWSPKEAMVRCVAPIDEDAGHGEYWEPRSSSVLWYGMMHPWTALAVKGLILNLQGEVCILPFMIGLWRASWVEKGHDEPAVLVAQFGCNTGDKGDPSEVSDARIDQMHFLEADRTALVVTSDFCDPASPFAIMHSPFKREEAARIAEAGEAITQGETDIPENFPVPLSVSVEPLESKAVKGSTTCESSRWTIRVEFDQELAVKPEFQKLHKKFPHFNGFTLYPAVQSKGWSFPVKLALAQVKDNYIILKTTLSVTDIETRDPWPGTLVYGDGAFPLMPLTNWAGNPVGSFKVDVPLESGTTNCPFSLFKRRPWCPGHRDGE